MRTSTRTGVRGGIALCIILGEFGVKRERELSIWRPHRDADGADHAERTGEVFTCGANVDAADSRFARVAAMEGDRRERN